jgi:glycerophosphoryl diester phosphodiesterase
VPRLLRPVSRPLVIAHRGASGIVPEQTIEAFDLATRLGADAIELDVVPSRDGLLLARHENELAATTNVAGLRRFAARRTTRTIEGGAITGWFAEDFTSEELRPLRARQRLSFRDHSFDDRFTVPTLDDVLCWRAALSPDTRVFIEIKQPTYFASRGLAIPPLLTQTLARHGALAPDGGVVLMSFETEVLRELRSTTDLPLIQLLGAPHVQPFDWAVSGAPRTYAEMVTAKGLARIATYADGIGPWKRLIVPADGPDADEEASDGVQLAEPTALVRDAHEAGLYVCAWTFRDEPRFLARDYAADPHREYAHFRALGLDAFITDFPATALAGLRN